MSREASEPLSDEDKQKIAAIQVKAMIAREEALRDQPFSLKARVKGRDYKTWPMIVREWLAFIGLHGVAVVGVFVAYFLLIIVNTAAIWFITSNAVVLGIMAPSVVIATWLWRTRKLSRRDTEQKLWKEIEVFRRGGHFNDVAENLRKLAAGGNLAAMLRLAELHDTGRGAPRSPKLAFDLVHQAAKRGHVPSQFALGERYLNGLGVTVDIQAAKQWYRFAAERGLPTAAMTLGYLCEHPRRQSEPDLEGAARWYRQATERFLIAKQLDDAKAAFAALKNVESDDAVLGRLQAHLESMASLNGLKTIGSSRHPVNRATAESMSTTGQQT
jgi:hypothetical protein